MVVIKFWYLCSLVPDRFLLLLELADDDDDEMEEELAELAPDLWWWCDLWLALVGAEDELLEEEEDELLESRLARFSGLDSGLGLLRGLKAGIVFTTFLFWNNIRKTLKIIFIQIRSWNDEIPLLLKFSQFNFQIKMYTCNTKHALNYVTRSVIPFKCSCNFTY